MTQFKSALKTLYLMFMSLSKKNKIIVAVVTLIIVSFLLS